MTAKKTSGTDALPDGRPSPFHGTNEPNVAAAVADAKERLVQDRKTGELRPPKGPGGRPRNKPVAEPEPPPPVVDEKDATLVGATVWELAGKAMGFRKLTDEEASQLGRALAPVMTKYGPFMAAWWAEVNLGLVVIALARATHIPKTPKPAPEKVEGEAEPGPDDESENHGDERMRVR